MVKQEAYRRSSRAGPGPAFWRQFPFPLPLVSALALVAALCLSTGLLLLAAHLRDAGHGYRASAGVWLILLSVCQAKMVLSIVRRGRAIRCLSLGWAFAGRLVLGLALCYLATLGVESPTAAGHLFVAASAAWYTALLVPVIDPQTFASLARWSLRHWPRRIERAAIGLSALLVAGEAGSRLLDWYCESPLRPMTALARLKLAPGTTRHGLPVNRHGYWDEEFQPHSVDKLRVAVLGSEVLLGGDAVTNCLVDLERRVPDVEVYNFGLPQGGPRHYVAQLNTDILPQQPDLVLVFVSVGHDLARLPPAPPVEDWRHLKVLPLRSRDASPPLAHAAGSAVDPPRVADYESYLRLTSRRLAVCRTPIDPAMKIHWRNTTSQLERTAAACRERKVPLGLVLVPGDFQISSGLCEAASRRAGIEPRQLDLELPQRRLACFAQKHDLPLIDLTPHLRAAPTSTFARHDCDLNEQGQIVASRVIATWLERRYASRLAALSQWSGD